jgi:hypothetical protein
MVSKPKHGKIFAHSELEIWVYPLHTYISVT